VPNGHQGYRSKGNHHLKPPSTSLCSIGPPSRGGTTRYHPNDLASLGRSPLKRGDNPTMEQGG
jgi:hypothetical protein